MRRRTCLGLLAASPLGVGPSPLGAQVPDPPDEAGWDAWIRAFLAPEGRVVDAPQGGISHSEGQGYGMVLATAFGDRAAFLRMRDWTDAALAVRQDALLAWRWRPDEAPESRDYNDASDGDLFCAWALLRGARRFGEPADEAGAIARALDAICVVDDPRGGGRLLLLPGAEGFRTGTGMVVNPSYLMPLALQELAAAFDLPRLATCAEDGVALLQALAVAGPMPDWIEVTPEGWRSWSAAPSATGYEAVRAPLWLVWSGRPGHAAVRAALDSDTAGPGGDRAAGYAALRALAACATATAPGRLPAYDAAQPYYPATLHLLAMTAARESGSACR